MKSRAIIPAIALTALALVCGCFGGGGNPVGGNPGDDNPKDHNPGGDDSPVSLVVGEITGPGTVFELDTASYTVTASGDSGIKYLWKLEPDTAGTLSDPQFATTDLHASEVDSDLDALLSVTVDSDNCEPQTVFKGVKIVDIPVVAQPPDEDSPIAVAKAEPLSQKPGVDIYFTDDGSFDPGGGDIVKWEWDWDNDGIFDDEGYDQHHAFHVFGNHLVQFRVTDDEGDTDILDQPLSVYIADGWGLTWGGAAGEWYDLDDAGEMALDAGGNICVVADYDSDLDIDPSTIVDIRPAGSYVSRFSPDGSLLNAFPVGSNVGIPLWSTDIGATFGSIDISPAGEVCVAGTTSCSNDMLGCYYVNAALGIYSVDGTELLSKAWQGISEWGGLSGLLITRKYRGLEVASDDYGSYMVRKYEYNYSWEPGGMGHPGDHETAVSVTAQRFSKELLDLESFEWSHSSTTSGYGPTLAGGTHMEMSDFQVIGGDILISGRESEISSNWSYVETNVTALFMKGTALNLPFQRVELGGDDVFPGKIAPLPDGSTYIAGYYTGQFDGHSSVGYSDCFLVRIGSAGSVDWSVVWGGIYDDLAADVVSDANGNAYVFGHFHGTADFDTSDGIYEVTATGGRDGFILKIDPKGTSKWVRTFGGSYPDDMVKAVDIAVDDVNCLYLLGEFRGKTDVDPTAGQQIHNANGPNDVFLIKMPAGGTW